MYSKLYRERSKRESACVPFLWDTTRGKWPPVSPRLLTIRSRPGTNHPVTTDNESILAPPLNPKQHEVPSDEKLLHSSDQILGFGPQATPYYANTPLQLPDLEHTISIPGNPTSTPKDKFAYLSQDRGTSLPLQ